MSPSGSAAKVGYLLKSDLKIKFSISYCLLSTLSEIIEADLYDIGLEGNLIGFIGSGSSTFPPLRPYVKA